MFKGCKKLFKNYVTFNNMVQYFHKMDEGLFLQMFYLAYIRINPLSQKNKTKQNKTKHLK